MSNLLVVDNKFNREWYRRDIGKLLIDTIIPYAALADYRYKTLNPAWRYVSPSNSAQDKVASRHLCLIETGLYTDFGDPNTWACYMAHYNP